jgi:hypothetical protein
MTQPIVPPTYMNSLLSGNVMVSFVSGQGTTTLNDTITSKPGVNYWHRLEWIYPAVDGYRQFDRSLSKVTRWLDKLDHALAASR